MEATIEKEKIVEVKLDDPRYLCDEINHSYNLFTVLHLALIQASKQEDSIPQEIVLGMSGVAYQIDELFGTRTIQFKKLIEEVISHDGADK